MLDDVSLHQLRTFIAAADEGGFSAGGRSDWQFDLASVQWTHRFLAE